MSNIKKGSKLTVSTANGISRASSNNLGVLEVSGPGLANVVSQDSTFSLSSSNVPQFTIGATDNSGIFQLGLDNQGNAILESTLNGNNKNILIQQLGGYVGIGTTNPASTLHVKSTDAIIIPVGTNTNRPGESGQITAQNGMIRYNTTTSQFEGFGPGSAWGSLGGVKDVDGDTYILAETSAGTDNDDLQFFTAGTQKMVILDNGYVGIGTTNPYCLLEVGSLGAGAGSYSNTQYNRIAFPSHHHANNRFVFSNRDPASNAAMLDINFVHTSASNNKHLMTFTDDGNVGIGETNPIVKLDIAGVTVTKGLEILTSEISTNTDTRPAIATRSSTVGIKDYEIAAIPNNYSARTSNYGADNGFLRIRAGGGTNATTTSYIDLTGYATNAVQDMNQNIVFGTSGTERMRIRSDGKVGIGTTTPNAKLDVNGNIYANGLIYLSTHIQHIGDSNNKFGFGASDDTFFVQTDDADRLYITAAYTYIYNALQISNKIFHHNNTNCWFGFPSNDTITFNTASVESMRIDSAGNVGIGTTSPYGKVEISDDWTNNGNAEAKAYLNFSNTNATYPSRWQIGPWKNGAGYKVFGIRGGGSTTDFTALNSLFTVHYDGYVGINQETNLGMGTGFKLQVNGQGVFCNNGTKANSVSIGDNGIRALIESRSTTHNLEFWVNGSSRLAIKANGNVGIGTTSPDYALDVVGDIRGSGNIGLGNGHRVSWSDGYTSAAFGAIDGGQNYLKFLTNAAYRMTIDSAGNVGIGTTSPLSKLNVAENGNCVLTIENTTGNMTAGRWIGQIQWRGQWITGNTTSKVEMGAIKVNAVGGGGTTGSYMSFHNSNGIERMRLDENGYVGIGTLDPKAKLHIHGGYLLIAENTNSRLNMGGVIGFYSADIGEDYPAGGPVQAYIGTRTHNYSGNQGGNEKSEMVFYIGNNESYSNWGPDRFNFIGGEVRFTLKSVYPTSNTWDTQGKAGLDQVCNQVDDDDVDIRIYEYSSSTGAHIGIGTTTAYVPLDIVTSTSQSPDSNGWWTSSTGDGAWYGNDYPPSGYHTQYNGNVSYGDLDGDENGVQISIHMVGGLFMENNSIIIITSDERIKKEIVTSDSNYCLSTLRNIPIREYKYIDTKMRGTNKTIGFIAQEVDQVFPMAVEKRRGFVPNEYRLLDDDNITWTETTDSSGNNCYKLTIHDLSETRHHSKYRFYVRNDMNRRQIKKEIMTITNEPKSFLFKKKYKEVFLWGRCVNNFHTIDKNKLFTLNFCATQELDRLQQQEIIKVQTHETTIQNQAITIQEQATKISTLEAQIADILTRLSSLENSGST